MNNVFTAIQNRDGEALSRMSGYEHQYVNNDNVVNMSAERLVDALFKQLKQLFPAAVVTNLKTPEQEVAAKQQWIAAFAEGGIRTREQVSAGMRHARASESPFWPSPGQFIKWCKDSKMVLGVTIDDVMAEFHRYSKEKSLYPGGPERFPWRHPVMYWVVCDNAAFDAASPEAQASFMRQADQLRRQQQAEYKTMIDSQVRDATAAYMRGVEFPNPPGEADFIAAYGVREGNLRYTEFRNTQIAGQYIGSFRNMPTSSITAYVEQLRPDTGDTGEGYAARAALYDNVVSAANQVIKQRQSDPVQFSLSSGQAKPIDMSNKDNFGQSVALRAAQVSDLAKSYGTPLTFFSKDEANQIGVFFRDAPVSQQAAYLDTIRQSTGGGQVYMSALQQISANAPSAAVAGILMDKPGGILAEKNWFNPDVSVSPETAAQTILAGAAARKGTDDAKGIPMPKDADLRLEFSDMVKDAFAGDAQGASMAYEIAKDYYAGVMAKKGVVSGEIDTDIWKQAVNVATGGVHDYNGMGNVLLPWGMSAEQFDKQVNQAWNEQVVGTGIKTPPGQYGLQSYGDSQYLVKLGTGYLLKDDGSPVVLDLTQKRQRFSGDIPQ